jgi:hypothetical protein
MLHVCAEHIDEKADHQAAAVLGIALVTLGEDVGSEMALRTYDHLLHYGGLPIRRAVPLGLALMNIRYTLLLLLLVILLLLALVLLSLQRCTLCVLYHTTTASDIATASTHVIVATAL